jgi:flagellar hook-associated protein 1
MSDLFGSLTSAARALQAQQTGLDVVGQNIANVNTAGYARRQIDLASVAPNDQLSAGGGVDVVGIRALRDEFLERRLRLERPSEGRESALADTLSVVETGIGGSGTSLDSSLDDFFDAWSNLSENATSSTNRQAVIIQTQAVATAFNEMATRFQDARRQADDGIRNAVDDINGLVSRIAGLNDSIARAGGGSMAASLQDEQSEAIKSLSQLVDVDVLPNKTGGVDVSFANGRALVIGVNPYQIGVGADAEGMVTLSSGGADVTGEISGGRIAGLLAARDDVIPGYQAQLDQLAYTLASTVNGQHATGYDLDGDPGGALFQPLTTVAGAAAALKIDAGVASDPRLIAAASLSAAGDNGNSRQLAALRTALVMGGGTGTFNEAWADLTYSVGQDRATASAELKSRQEIVTQIESLRDSVSGVSLDEEAMLMMKFQRAYEANARFFTTVDSAIATLLGLVGN